MQIKLWLINLIVAVLHALGIKAHKWFFDREKWAARRERHRAIVWKYKEKAEFTKEPLDNDRADCLCIYMKFEHSPEQVEQARLAKIAGLAPTDDPTKPNL